ncbi:dihydrodipicolinate synthase family protein [Evansella halocellulosilytica]|uniref:dihydrodipicolinate synthase family protein n=1 Tax=Evansella halocellulosilytica TaxID=2011013 RepID=UPI000BB81894|nr:dihydrodipicolinate synthase family protein [Evansella halocellulosilytica]
MERVSTIQGIIPPVVTLFDSEGNIDIESNKKFTDWLIGQGVHGILYLGSMGEFSALTLEERKMFTEEMIAQVNGRIPVYIGTGTTNLKDTINHSKHASETGANGILVVNPFYWNYPEEQLFDYFISIADSVDIPVLIYNITMLTGQTLSPDLIQRLAASHKNIAGMKDTINDIGHVREVLTAVSKDRPDFAMLTAFDDHLLPGLHLGAAGSINGISNFAPHLAVNLFEAYKAKDYETAIHLHKKLTKLMDLYKINPLLFMTVKEVLYQLSIIPERTGGRAPSSVFEEKLISDVKTFLETHDSTLDLLQTGFKVEP